MKKCVNCGREWPDNLVSCFNCGKLLLSAENRDDGSASLPKEAKNIERPSPLSGKVSHILSETELKKELDYTCPKCGYNRSQHNMGRVEAGRTGFVCDFDFEADLKKLREKAEGSVSLIKYCICEYCDFDSSEEDEMIDHLIEKHAKELRG